VTGQQFGDRLRRERERRGVSLASIAQTTKIGRTLLVSLEQGDCSRWPGGIYARAYFRAYARAIGLHPEELVADFCEIFPQFAPPPAVEPEVEAAGISRSPRRGWLTHLRELCHRADGRFDLLFRVERSE
jgi:transcriptional regulator with XRE-family HTH domain